MSPVELSAQDLPSWYAVHVRSNQERSTAVFLARQDVEVFLPQYRVLSTRQDRRVTLLRPLFASYLFVHLSLISPQKVQVLKAPGTVRIIGFGDVPTPVPSQTIDSLKILVGNGEDQVRPHPLVQVGRQVAVIDGPFKGAQGMLCEPESKKGKLVVEIRFLGRAVAVLVDLDQVAPLF